MLVLTIGIVGLTIAYFSNTSSITNIFSTNPYGTTVTEEFVSPSNWTPGTSTDKTLTVTNSGNVDEAVRVSFVETWTSANSNVEGDLPLSQNNNAAAFINWTNTDDWTTVTENNKTYKYYNYKLSPNEETSELLDKVTFNPLITNSSTCEEAESNGVKTITCNSSGNGYDGATYKLVFTIETVQYNKYIEAWGTNVVIAEEKPQPAPTGVEYLATEATNPANAEYNESTKGKMFQFTHTLNEGTENETIVNESRYIGDAPNNYVYFNCDEPVENQEYNYATSCEVWRILGVFDVERTDPDYSTKTITETRMKLVRGRLLDTTMAWDTRNSEQYANGNYGKNDWNGSVINTYLNEDYYNELTDSAKSQIEDAIYFLGGLDSDSTSYFGNVDEIFVKERGTTVYNNMRPTVWKGKIGLMYPSDMYMTYGNGVSEVCYNNPNQCNGNNAQSGWLYMSNNYQGNTGQFYVWFLTPASYNSYDAMYSYNMGNLRASRFSYSNFNYGVRPVIYLKSSIKIKSGTGEEGNPYVLE